MVGVRVGVGVGVGVRAGAGICLELKPEISKIGGSGNPAKTIFFVTTNLKKLYIMHFFVAHLTV